MQIVLPSVVSGIGLVFLLLGIFIDQTVVRIVFLSVGGVLLWLDFFITMAIFRFTVRDIDKRLARIEESVNK
jgi:ABC-type spermidine/putrescine transport system permease subunit II